MIGYPRDRVTASKLITYATIAAICIPMSAPTFAQSPAASGNNHTPENPSPDNWCNRRDIVASIIKEADRYYPSRFANALYMDDVEEGDDFLVCRVFLQEDGFDKTKGKWALFRFYVDSAGKQRFSLKFITEATDNGKYH